MKIKEQLVNQLKTQISDLERFIAFLQGEASSPGPYVQKSKSQNCEKCGTQMPDDSHFPIFDQPNREGSTRFSTNNQSTKLEADNVN